MNRCERAQGLLPQVLVGLGEVEEADASMVRSHLVGCPACREESERLRSLFGTLAAAEVPEPGEAYWNAFLPRLRSRLARETPSGPVIPLPSLLAFAVSAAVFLLAATFVGRWGSTGSAPIGNLSGLVQNSTPSELTRAYDHLFPEAGMSTSADEAIAPIATPDEMQEALDTLLPGEDDDLYSTAQNLPPEARSWLVEVLGPGTV